MVRPVGVVKLLGLLSVFLLQGCATQSQTALSGEYSPIIKEALLGKAFLGREIVKEDMPNFDLFAITPEMAAFAEKSVRRSDSLFDRVKSLHVALLSKEAQGGRGISYSAYTTEVPTVSFAERKANCMSFTLLYVALARHLDIFAQVNEVEIPPTWDLRAKNSMVFLRHVNVKVPLRDNTENILHRDDVVIDLEMDRYRPTYIQRFIDDHVTAAQFYSNRAVELEARDDFKDAFINLRKSLYENDQQSYIWSNMAGLFGKKGFYREAEAMYLHALELNPEDLTVMSNLAWLYNRWGSKAQWQKYTKLAQRYRDSNPFYQYSLAQSAFEQKDYVNSLYYVRRAIEREPKEERFYILAKSIYENLGQSTQASQMQKKVDALNSK